MVHTLSVGLCYPSDFAALFAAWGQSSPGHQRPETALIVFRVLPRKSHHRLRWDSDIASKLSSLASMCIAPSARNVRHGVVNKLLAERG